MEKPKLVRVWIEHVADTCHDTSCLGEYHDTVEEWSICRCCGEYIANVGEDHEIPSRGRECRFFRPYAGGEPAGTEDYQKYGKQDYDRMESLEQGHWYYIGIVAKAEFDMPSRVRQILRSGGLFGIESDSDAEYFDEVAKEELAELRIDLESMGIPAKQIDAAFADVKVECD